MKFKSSERRAFLKALLFFSLCCAVLSPKIYAAEERLKAQTTDPSQGPFAYVIGPQNVLQIKIFGDASASQIYRVDELGTIKHALIGSVKVGGLSVAETEKLIETKLADGYIIDPRVTIFVLEHSRFSVIGEVKKPGTFEILGKVSIIEAISMAGGFTGVANQRDVKIIRKQNGRESTVNVDATRVTEKGDISANVYIEADDVIVISKSFF